MSRDTGPRVKRMRALGVNLPGLSRKTIDRRPYGPGQHGSERRRRQSDYGLQLQEKQKLRLNYGVSERQMRRLMLQARKSTDPTGAKLLELLERRLDNVVFRAGFAPTIPAARQLVNHRHVLRNGRRADIASIRVNTGDVITLRVKAREMQTVKDSVLAPPVARPDWMEFDEGEVTATIRELPSADSVPFPIDVQQVVEFYSRRL